MIEAVVTDVRARTPDLVRVTLAGEGLRTMHVTAPTQWFKLHVPPRLPPGDPAAGGDDWNGRPYTVRHHRADVGEVDVDIVLHGDGPVAGWAMTARSGDRVRLGDLKGRFDYPEDASWWLLAADDSARPAALTIIESMPEGTPVTAFFEVSGPGSQEGLDLPSTVRVCWVHRAEGDAALPAAIVAYQLPEGTGYAWVAGESSAVRSIHLHLAASGMHRHQLRTKGYWKRGVADLRA